MGTVGARVVVRADHAVHRRRLALYGVTGFPAVCALGALTIGEFGAAWLVPFLVLGLLPVVCTFVLTALRGSLARIAVVGDELRIDNAFGANVYSAPVEFLTGLHPITFSGGLFTPVPGRVVVVSDSTRPYVIDLRLWRSDDVQRLWRRLRDVPVSEEGASTAAELRARFRGVRIAWWHTWPRSALLVLTALAVGCLFLVHGLFT